MRAMRSDANARQIKLALEKLGCTVEFIHSQRAGIPDLLVGIHGRNYLVEVKVPKTGRLSDAQKAWRDSWNGSKPFVIRTTDDVVGFYTLVALISDP